MTIGIRHDVKGYAYGEFEDSEGRRCSIAESSTDGHLWLGHDNDGPRMHLDQEKVRALLPLLQHFEAEAELLYPPDHGEDRVHEPLNLITHAEPANGRIRLDMREAGRPGETWHFTEAQARGVVLVLSLAISGREMTAEAAPAREVTPFGDCTAIVKMKADATPEENERLMAAVEEWQKTPQPLVSGMDMAAGPDRTEYALRVPCDACDGTGTVTPDGGHGQNGADICGRCGGEGRILASTGETARAAFDPATGGYVGDREGGR